MLTVQKNHVACKAVIAACDGGKSRFVQPSFCKPGPATSFLSFGSVTTTFVLRMLEFVIKKTYTGDQYKKDAVSFIR